MATQQPEEQSSMTDRIQKELHVPEEQRRPLWIGLLAGLIIGILIGWFVLGWGLFPVNYSGGAYVNHLNEEAQADYLSAVADAYVTRRDDASLALAQYRLRAFIGEGTLNEAFQDAETHIIALHSTMPENAFLTRDVLDGRVRMENLDTLAASIEMQSEIATDADTTPTENTATTKSTEQAASDPQSAKSQSVDAGEEAGGMALLKWLLIGFVAFLLIVGGFFILRSLIHRRDDDDDGGGSGTHARDGGSWDDDPTDATTGPGYSVKGHTTTAGRAAGQQPAGQPTHTLNATVDPEKYADYTFSDDPGEGREGYEQSVQEKTPAYGQVEFEDESDWPDDLEVADSPMAAAVKQPTPIKRVQTLRGSVLATNIAYFRAGEADYDEAFELIDPDTGVNVGDSGMGVTMPGGLRDNHPQEVISLDVWLFDKLDESHIGNYKRVLISEYVVDQGIESNFKNIQGSAGDPIVAQPDTPFNIEGNNLKLLCRVIEAEYSQDGATKGIFTSVKVEMTVLKKG